VQYDSPLTSDDNALSIYVIFVTWFFKNLSNIFNAKYRDRPTSCELWSHCCCLDMTICASLKMKIEQGIIRKQHGNCCGYSDRLMRSCAWHLQLFDLIWKLSTSIAVCVRPILINRPTVQAPWKQAKVCIRGAFEIHKLSLRTRHWTQELHNNYWITKTRV